MFRLTKTAHHAPILFIVGTPRSGTSLLQTLLACHPQTRPIPESYLFADLTPTVGQANGLPPTWRRPIPTTLSVPAAQRFITGLRQRRVPDYIDWSQFISDCTIGDRVNIAQLVRYFFALHATGNSQLIIEKTPTHLYFIDEICTLLPDARFVQIVRDPRDQICSFADMIRSARGSSPSLYDLSRAWRIGVEIGRRHGIRFVRYEDLVRNPFAVVEPIAKWMGLAFEPAYLERQTEVSDQTRPSNAHWNMRTRRPITQQRISRYRTDLSPLDIRLVETVCRNHMTTYGYTPTSDPLATHLMLRQQLAHAVRRTGLGCKQGIRSALARIKHSHPWLQRARLPGTHIEHEPGLD